MLPEADGIYGNAAPGRIVEFLENHLNDGPMCYLPERELFFPFRRNTLNFPGSVYIKIAEGCANNCTYCAIPLIRGTLVSREIGDILEEVESFLEKGIHEFNFIGQDLASFGVDRGGRELERLLRGISELEGDFWIRLLYMHPDHFPLEILSLCNDDVRILPYFDIPFQHASAKVLRRMGRKGDAEGYLDLISRIRDSVSSAVIRSTFLTGFPGETGEDFRTLLDFQQRAKLDWAGVFTYSREEGTPAYRYRGALGTRLARGTMNKRRMILERNQQEITAARLDRFLGRQFDVLVEENILGEELSLGRMYAQAPEVDGLVVLRSSRITPGTVVKANISRRNGLDLEAEVEGPP
jgi:ribosomal protein S12 methylthiotransferase